MAIRGKTTHGFVPCPAAGTTKSLVDLVPAVKSKFRLPLPPLTVDEAVDTLRAAIRNADYLRRRAGVWDYQKALYQAQVASERLLHRLEIDEVI